MSSTGDRISAEAPKAATHMNGIDLTSARLPVAPHPINRTLRHNASTAVVEIVRLICTKCAGRDDLAFNFFNQLSDAALTRVHRFEGKRTPPPRMQDLILGMYVAEPDGIWTPIGTVSEKRLSEYRKGSPRPSSDQQFHNALSQLTLHQLNGLLDQTLANSRLLDRVMVPFIKLDRHAVPLRRAAIAREVSNRESNGLSKND